MSKFIIVAKLPASKTPMAFSVYEDKKTGENTFALVAFEGESVKMALTWDTFKEAQDHLDKQLELALDKGVDLSLLSPEVREAWEPN